MRLTEEKVDYLCHKIYKVLDASKACVWERAEAPAVAAIKKVILDDLKTEDDLEEEARRILDEHMDEIRLRGADYQTMFRKTKSHLARERKIVL